MCKKSHYQFTSSKMTLFNCFHGIFNRFMIWNIVKNKNSKVLYVTVCLKMWAVAHKRSSTGFYMFIILCSLQFVISFYLIFVMIPFSNPFNMNLNVFLLLFIIFITDCKIRNGCILALLYIQFITTMHFYHHNTFPLSWSF